MNTMTAPACTASSTVLGYLLHALSASDTYPYAPHLGLPNSTIWLDDHGLVLSATHAAPPLFRDAVAKLAVEQHCDVLLVRIIDVSEHYLDTSVDFTLGLLPCEPWSLRNWSLWAGADDQLWLVPDAFAPCVLFAPDGLHLELIPPFPTMAQRSAGVLRAAAQLKQLFRPAEVLQCRSTTSRPAPP